MTEVRVPLTGAVDLHCLPSLLMNMEWHLAHGAEHVIFDCEGLTFLDSTGIGLIAMATRAAKVSVVNVPEPVLRTFDVCGLSNLIEKEAP